MRPASLDQHATMLPDSAWLGGPGEPYPDSAGTSLGTSLGSDPLRDVTLLEHVAAVLRGGEVVKPPDGRP